MKNTITILAYVLILVALVAMPAWAGSTCLELIGDVDGLSLVPPGKKLFDLDNMAPGDRVTATIMIHNHYSRSYHLWLKATDHTAGKPDLLKQLQLTVTYKGKEIYDGPAAGFAKKSVYLGRVWPGEDGELIATVELPGSKTGNDFQGVNASVKWVFTAQTASGPPWEPPEEPPEEPPAEEHPVEEPPVEPPEEEPPVGETPEEIEPPPVEEVPLSPLDELEMPKTGEEAPYPYYLLGGLAILAGVSLAGPRKRR
ncbi:MAG TPA: LPXTG cell wall anchor domain-containing protein [Firmicutes bacterium]|jgi:LPXTG-motif cell wall-anchored protein|nr:LPXTG cell wall anchor domain-containing protein [Candidatus Fermentithermobacillaceae bacterium]